ncbi:MAG: Crp/Fnr family transcriptional regulator [Saprospiraceae bacterium]|nr:Crp/Fnr family transcriptional regulator [Saprospiraceae bacterium]
MNSQNLPKNTFLQREGDLHTKVYYVRKGLLRSYSIDEQGKEHTFMFGPEGWTVGDASPPESPAVLFIQAMEDSEVIALDKDPQREVEHVQRLLKRIEVLQKRVITLMSATATERYRDFLETYPDIVQRIPQKYIASYLGMTPEMLSKVKRSLIS